MRHDRYSRQIMVFGETGQERLLKSSVLVVGAGGLGSAVVGYLAAAGVGRIGIADGDAVEESNLQRQIIHAGNVGMNKAESAALFVEKLNPEVVVDVYPYNVSPNNVRKLIREYDVVAGCPDNFKTRFLLNDACKLEGKPFVHAAVYAYEGEVAVFTSSPCYRCYIPKVVEPNNRAIVGPTAGVFGSMQATEVVKLITGSGEVLEGEVLRGDLSSMELFRIRLKQRRDCPVCAEKLKGIFPENYEDDCGVKTLR